MVAAIHVLAQPGPTRPPSFPTHLPVSVANSPTVNINSSESFVRKYVLGVARLAIPPGSSPARIGRGYDSLTNEIKEQCVVFRGTREELESVLPEPRNSDSQAVSYSMSHITDSEQLFNKLSLSATVAFQKGIYSGNATASYASESRISRYLENFLVNVNVVNLTQFLKTVELTEAAKRVKTNPLKFRQMCGDQYILGITTGGVFSAVFNASSSTEEEQRKVSAALAIAAQGSSFNSELMSEFRSLHAQGRLGIEILRQGPTDNIPRDLDAIRAYAESFPAKVKPTGGAPWPITMNTSAYGTMGPPITGEEGEFLDAAAIQFVRLKRLLGGLQYVAAHPEQFGGFDLNKYRAESTEIEASLRELQAKASACALNAKQCGKPSFQRPRELPDRLRWVIVDPARSEWTPIRDVQGGERRVVEARGQWTAWNTYDPWLGPSTGGLFWVHEITGKDHYLPATTFYPIPDFSSVYFRIVDSRYDDNHNNPNDLLRAAVYTPVYPY